MNSGYYHCPLQPPAPPLVPSTEDTKTSCHRHGCPLFRLPNEKTSYHHQPTHCPEYQRRENFLSSPAPPLSPEPKARESTCHHQPLPQPNCPQCQRHEITSCHHQPRPLSQAPKARELLATTSPVSCPSAKVKRTSRTKVWHSGFDKGWSWWRQVVVGNM